MGFYDLRAEIEQMLLIARALVYTDPAETLRLAQFISFRAQSINDARAETQATLLIALAFRATPSVAEGVREHMAEVACQLAQHYADDESWLTAIDCHADVAYDIANYAKAMDLWLQLLKRSLAQQWPEGMARAYIGLGKLFFISEDLASSLATHLKVAPLLAQICDKNLHICHHINIAAAQLHLNHDTAAQLALDRAEALLCELPFCEFEPELHYYRAHLLRKAGQQNLAKQQLERALALSARSCNHWGKVVNMIALGELHLEQQQTHASQYFMQQALDTATEIPAKYLVQLAHAGLAKSYAASGQTDLEFTHWQQHFAIYEEIKSNNQRQQLSSSKLSDLLRHVEQETIPNSCDNQAHHQQ
ncbi:hypothetical protein [uncultured Deefgea sp.]|uniref:hypothetical protein n=1 Tax=uncultured Deefgea sp. TaxID=1304914 RepID=UPI0025967E13|nr:hypothetical protein [uncultured Deefgea sp.]